MIQRADIFTLPAALPLEEGGLLVNAQVAYQTHGELSGENSIVLVHDLASSLRAVAEAEASAFRPSGWARGLVGPDAPLNPASDFLVSPNLLGSPFGSTSALTLNPSTGKPFGPAFPTITVEDMARALGALVRGLRVRRVRAVLGVGLGGMVALRAAALFQDLTAGVIALGAAKSLPEGLREQLALTEQLLQADPAFRSGEYQPGQGPTRALKKLRLDMLRRVYGRDWLVANYSDYFGAERQLEAEAEAFAEAFDANCYARLCAAYGACDLTEWLPKVGARVLLVACSTDDVAPPLRIRDTYHLLTASGVNTRYYELQSNGGHATLTIESHRLRGPISEFLATLD